MRGLKFLFVLLGAEIAQDHGTCVPLELDRDESFVFRRAAVGVYPVLVDVCGDVTMDRVTRAFYGGGCISSGILNIGNGKALRRPGKINSNNVVRTNLVRQIPNLQTTCTRHWRVNIYDVGEW